MTINPKAWNLAPRAARVEWMVFNLSEAPTSDHKMCTLEHNN